MKLFTSRIAPILALTCLLVLTAEQAFAATVDVCLRVDQYQIPGSTATVGPFGNTAPITMWGFVQTGTGPGCTFTAAGPGANATAVVFPTLAASAGDTLQIHLMNNLPAPVAPPATGAVYTEPVSAVIPGQPSVMTPTRFANTDANYPGRVRSFTAETPQQSTTPVVYTFGPLQAGTYLIQSGTHQAVQMQMGLYGVLKVYGTAPIAPATSGRAYTAPSSAFDSEVALLFSEIDPVLHNAVASGQYGPNTAPPAGWLTSTIGYHSKYFLVNGAPYTTSTKPISLAPSRTVLLRFLNAGLDTKVPVLQGQYVSVIAEDGNFYTTTGFTGTPPNLVPGSCPAPRLQYSVLLPAGKTADAILTPPATSPVVIPIYDRRLHLTNNGASPGGMLALLTTTATGGGASPPPLPAPCALVGGP